LAHLRRETFATRAPQGYPAASFVSAKDPNGNRTVEENEAAIRTVLKSEG